MKFPNIKSLAKVVPSCRFRQTRLPAEARSYGVENAWLLTPIDPETVAVVRGSSITFD